MTDAQLQALVAEFTEQPVTHDDAAHSSYVLDLMGVPHEGANLPSGEPTRHDLECGALALVVARLAEALHVMRDAMVTAREVPTLTLAEAVAS